MKYVEFYKLQKDGAQKSVAVCRLLNGLAVCEGEKQLVENLERAGIRDYSQKDMKRLFPRDGLKFLEQLKYNFKSGYLNASDVKEE